MPFLRTITVSILGQLPNLISFLRTHTQWRPTVASLLILFRNRSINIHLGVEQVSLVLLLHLT